MVDCVQQSEPGGSVCPAASLLLTPSIDYLTLFTRGLSLGLIAALITGFFQKFYLGMMIPEAMMGNALVYASISQIAGLFVFASYKRENGLWRWLYVLAFLSSVVILIITLRRMPLFVFCIELILIAAFFSWYVRPTKLQIIAIVVGLITAGTTSIIVMASTGSLFDKRIVSQWQMLQEHGLTTDAVIDEYRLTLYRHGIGVVADHPFLGVGLQNATDTAIRRAEDEENRSIKNFTHLHNEYLNATAGSGIPGLVATILFLIAPIMMTLRSTKDSRYPERMFVAIGLTGSYSILGLTNLITGHDLMLGFFCFSYLVLVLANEQADRNLSLVLKRAANPRSEAMS